MHKALKRWAEAATDGSEDSDIKAGIKALTEVIKGRIYIKRSGKDYDQFRRELSNHYNRRSSEYPQDVVEANR